MCRFWIAVAGFATLLGAAAPAAAGESWRYCEAYTKDSKYYQTPLHADSEFWNGMSYAASRATVGLDLRYSYDCWGDGDRGVAEARRLEGLARARGNGFTPVPWDLKERTKHNLSYYYCHAYGGNRRKLYSDLFVNPGWYEPSLDGNPFGKLARDYGGNGYDTKCWSATPLQYINHLNQDAANYQLVHADFVSAGKPLGPNIVEDPALREKYAKLWADPKNLPVPGGPPPKPVQAAAPKPAQPQVGSLTIKQDTSAADTRRAWDQQVAKTLAEEAQKKAQLAVKQAQNDAKMKELAEKARLERKKRGSAQ